MTPYVQPQFQLDAYNCPHCHAYANQINQEIRIIIKKEGGLTGFPQLTRKMCSRCGVYTLWHNTVLIYPEATGISPPNPDLNEDIKADYLEAASIVNKSPRGAAALLRLCIQKLCQQLGQKGKNIDDDIAHLVKDGLPVKIQQALDFVRVIGNECVHPGTIDMKDNRETALRLFDLVNAVANDRITHPKEIDALYKTLPQDKRDWIKKRDQGTP